MTIPFINTVEGGWSGAGVGGGGGVVAVAVSATAAGQVLKAVVTAAATVAVTVVVTVVVTIVMIIGSGVAAVDVVGTSSCVEMTVIAS